MVYSIVGVIIYIVMGIIFGLTINLMAIEQIGTGDEEFDNAMADTKMRFFAIFILSIIWVITLPTILIINIFNKGEI